MSLTQANKEKTRVRLGEPEIVDEDVLAVLPEQLVELIQRTSRLQADVRRLDATIHAPAPASAGRANPLDRQLGLLKAAFEGRERP
jgi:regulator of CtrA degradation